MTQKELDKVLNLHKKWIDSDSEGVRANLRYANLSYADLRYANLSGADLRYANLRYANLRAADLSDANLRAANLSYADLRYANLSGADLRYANLRAADLSDANLRYANLSYADLRYANLSGADLRYANLRAADLSDANLSYANLSGADLSYANLSGADLEHIKADFFKILSSAKNEVLGLYDALNKGLVDGSTYRGKCACLIGTIANVRGEDHCSLEGELRPDGNRPAEKWFLAIKKGDLPLNNQASEITAEWVREFAKDNNIELPTYKIVSSFETGEK